MDRGDDFDATLVGIFDGIAYQIVEYLSNAEGIGTIECWAMG